MSYKTPRKGEQAPIIVEEQGHSSHHEQRIDHPAFGQISVSRVTAGGGGINLYDSDFGHNEIVSIEVKHSQLNRSLSRDWHYAREPIVQLYMSASQWATFVSSFNSGSGVPCTLNWEKGIGQIPGIPEVERSEAYKHDMRNTTKEAVERLDKLKATIEDMGLPKKKAEELLSQLRGAHMSVSSSIQFVNDQFEEHVENVIEKSKVEVENYLTSRIHRAGLAALQNQETSILRLDSGVELQ